MDLHSEAEKRIGFSRSKPQTLLRTKTSRCGPDFWARVHPSETDVHSELGRCGKRTCADILCSYEGWQPQRIRSVAGVLLR